MPPPSETERSEDSTVFELKAQSDPASASRIAGLATIVLQSIKRVGDKHGLNGNTFHAKEPERADMQRFALGSVLTRHAGELKYLAGSRHGSVRRFQVETDDLVRDLGIGQVDVTVKAFDEGNNLIGHPLVVSGILPCTLRGTSSIQGGIVLHLIKPPENMPFEMEALASHLKGKIFGTRKDYQRVADGRPGDQIMELTDLVTDDAHGTLARRFDPLFAVGIAVPVLNEDRLNKAQQRDDVYCPTNLVSRGSKFRAVPNTMFAMKALM